MRRPIPAFFLLLLFGRLTPAADDVSALKSALERPILAAGQVHAEVRAFVEPRIIAPPRPNDRASWEQEVERLRRDMLEQVVFRGRAAGWRDAKCGVVWLDAIDGGPGYRIRKFRYEALPGMWIPGLLYLPDDLEGNVPVAVNVNGHTGHGKAVDYKQLRAINLAKRGILSLNLEWFGMGQLAIDGFHHGRMNQLDLCGASGLAPFYLALARGIDVGLSLDRADPQRVLVTGLSGGGWQTILIGSLDERVALANPVAGYGSFHTNIAFDDMGDSEQAPVDMATVADYAHLTAMRAPRPTLLTYNANDDCCFKSGHTLGPLLEAARPAFALYGAEDRLRWHVNHVPGTHNFELENRRKLYAAVGDYFYPNDATFVRSEIASEPEIKSAEELHVPLPEENVDFQRLAQALLADLPREPELPEDKRAAESWQRQKRDQLRALLCVPSYQCEASAGDVEEADEFVVTRRIFKCGETWSVPCVEIAPRGNAAKQTTMLVADEGRASLAGEVKQLVAAGCRVLAVDPLFVGESKVAAQDPEYTYPLFLSTVGERALGIQAAQLAAIARWAREAHGKPVEVRAIGRRSTAAALVAAALSSESIAGAELSGSLASFKQLVEENRRVQDFPELFPFGLLVEFDVRQLAALSAPRPVKFREADARAVRELEPLVAWYALFGAEFELR